MEVIEKIDFKNSLELFNKTETFIISAVAKIAAIPNVATLKLDIELTSYVCNIIENEIVSSKSKNKTDKKKIFFRIKQEIFTSLNEQEKKILGEQIEYLLENGKIKKIDPVATWFKSVGLWIKKKIV
jgi:hypothetical protein